MHQILGKNGSLHYIYICKKVPGHGNEKLYQEVLG